MSTAGTEFERAAVKRRIRNGALGLASLAFALYVGFMALLIYRSRH